jgi:hypothetical protein
MRNTRRLFIAATLTIISTLSLHAQTEFPLGVYLFELTNVDYGQIRNDLGATWVQGWGPSGVDTNSVGLKTLSIRNNIYPLCVCER